MAISRRTALSAAAVGLASPRLGFAAPTFATSADILRAFVRLRGALDGRLVYWWLEDVRSAVVATRVYPLFRARVGTFLRVKDLGAGGFSVTTLETSYYVDLKTDQLLHTLKNPINGKDMDIASVVLGPSTAVIRAEGEDAPRTARGGTLESHTSRGPVTVAGDDVLIAEDRFARITFPDPSTPPYNTSELNVYRGRLSQLSDPDRPYVDAWVSYQSVSAFQPRHKMDGVIGHISARAVGAKVASLEAMPKRWRELVERENPEIVANIEKVLSD